MGGVDIPEGPSSVMPATSEIPLATVIGDTAIANNGDETDAPETDDEEFRYNEEVVFEDLEDLKGDLVWVAMEASLRDSSMIGPSGSQPTVEVTA
ncbi:hypothetical protein KY285_008862 [Solanum tuberosum]|nr:hypothetical protein KY284_008862 [Solanum tuberosum]KAH0747205.1 hypothetical protein KY285_008862 [Solanum tuberosum]